MTSLRYLTCLFLLTVSLTNLSKAGCRDQFTKKAWKQNLTDRLPDNISIQIDRKSKDVMLCSVKNNSKARTSLGNCFDNTGNCTGKSRNINVTFYHLMCLTDIAMTEKESEAIAEDVCKVYEKVCQPFLKPSSASAPKMTTSSTATATTASPATPTTATAPLSSPKMTTPTSSTATATTASPTTATAPLSLPKMTTPTSSTATATTASPTTATAPPSSPKMTTPTSSKATATTASTTAPTTATAPPSSPETATSTSSTATTVSPATPTTESVTTETATAWQSASERSAQKIRACATETDIFKLKIVIAFLIFTNILGPLAVYTYMRRQRNKESFNDVNRNMPDTVQMTIQPQTVVQTEDNGEGAVLLQTPQCSVIINPPETTQTKKLYQNELEH